jgi:hypothetical protein
MPRAPSRSCGVTGSPSASTATPTRGLVRDQRVELDVTGRAHRGPRAGRVARPPRAAGQRRRPHLRQGRARRGLDRRPHRPRSRVSRPADPLAGVGRPGTWCATASCRPAFVELVRQRRLGDRDRRPAAAAAARARARSSATLDPAARARAARPLVRPRPEQLEPPPAPAATTSSPGSATGPRRPRRRASSPTSTAARRRAGPPGLERRHRPALAPADLPGPGRCRRRGPIDAELARDDTDLGQRAGRDRPGLAARPGGQGGRLGPAARGHLAVAHHVPAAVGRVRPARPGGGARALHRSLLRRRSDRVGERSLDWAIEFSTAMFPHWAASRRCCTASTMPRRRGRAARPLRGCCWSSATPGPDPAARATDRAAARRERSRTAPAAHARRHGRASRARHRDLAGPAGARRPR